MNPRQYTLPKRARYIVVRKNEDIARRGKGVEGRFSQTRAKNASSTPTYKRPLLEIPPMYSTSKKQRVEEGAPLGKEIYYPYQSPMYLESE